MHKGEFFLQVLQDIKVKDIMRTDPEIIHESTKFLDLVKYIASTKHNSFPVVNSENKLVGVLRFEEVREFVFEEGLEDIVVAGEICDTHPNTVLKTDSLADAMEKIGFKNIELLPVVNNKEENILEGIITRRDIISTYNKSMIKLKKNSSDDVL
jgi:CIC family chloride channel protein